MKIALGSENKNKRLAVLDLFSNLSFFWEAELYSINVHSGISGQPLTKDDIYNGAKNRAKSAYESIADCTYGIGIESGLVPNKLISNTMDEITVCRELCINTFSSESSKTYFSNSSENINNCKVILENFDNLLIIQNSLYIL